MARKKTEYGAKKAEKPSVLALSAVFSRSLASIVQASQRLVADCAVGSVQLDRAEESCGLPLGLPQVGIWPDGDQQQVVQLPALGRG